VKDPRCLHARSVIVVVREAGERLLRVGDAGGAYVRAAGGQDHVPFGVARQHAVDRHRAVVLFERPGPGILDQGQAFLEQLESLDTDSEDA